MGTRKVRAGAKYFYVPVLMDKVNPPAVCEVKEGQLVKVVNLHGCPPANTMGMCHILIEDLNNYHPTYGYWKFAGMVCTNSLWPIKEYKKKEQT